MLPTRIGVCDGAGRTDRPPRGFTLIEMLAVITLATVLLTIAAPRLLSTSASVAVLSARSRISSAVSIARASSTRFGTVAYVVLDVAMDRVRVEVDTTTARTGTPVEIHTIDLWEELGIDLRASAPVMCFDPRGLVVTGGACPGTAVVVWVQRGQRIDSVTVSSTGWVSP